MEDALVHNEYFLKPENLCVLILVLMEDALVLFKSETVCWKMVSLNPCFNGRCTRTVVSSQYGMSVQCLNPCFNGRCTRTPLKRVD